MATVDEYIISVRTKGDKKAKASLKGVGKAGKDMGLSLDKALGSVAGLAGGFFAAQGLINALKKSIELAGRFQGVSAGFENLTAQAGFSTDTFKKLNDALDGTANSIDIMRQANNAMLLGIFDSEDQMAEMFDIAQRLAQALGKDTTFGIESLVTGLGRQSKLMLDNLGIMIDTNKAYEDFAISMGKTVKQLTDQERKQAFVNATMKSARELSAGLGEETATLNTEMAKLNTILDEMAIGVGEALTPNLEETSIVIDNLQRLFTAENAEAFTTQLLNVAGGLAGMIPGVDLAVKFHEAFGLLKDRTGEVADGMENIKSPFDLEDLENLENIQISYAGVESTVENAKTAYDAWLGSTMDLNNAKQMELEFIERLKVEYPELAEAMGMVETKTKASSTAIARSTGMMFNALSAGMEQFKGGAKAAARLQQVSALVNAYATINKIMADPKLIYPTNVIQAVAVGAQAFANVMQISKAMGEFKTAATGMDEMVTKPTLILAGEAGPEHVNITPTGGGTTGGGNTFVFNNPITSEQWVESEFIDMLETAARRRGGIAVS